MPINANTFNDLVEQIYDAALDECKWKVFLENYRQAIDADSTIIRQVEKTNRTAQQVASVGYDPAWQKQFCEHFVKIDFQTPALASFEMGKAFVGLQTMPLEQQKKTEFYNDFMLKAD